MDRNNILNSRRILNILLLILILAVGIKLFFHYNYYAYFSYYNQKLIAFIESFHPYDDIVFIVIQIFQVLVAGAIPAEISGFVGGYLYGPIVGTVYSTIGFSIGSWLAFLLSRRYGLPLVRRVVNPSIMDKYDHFIVARGPLVSFILFLIPGFPKAALCYILGLSQMNIWTFIGVSTIGRLFGTILLSLTGDSVRAMRIVLLFIILGIVVIIYLVVYIYREKLFQMSRENRK
ncbi:MAG TPA: VTT domain-containing protein [Syntrophales bacterium]|nr:VTT domain-containing protein [Syntrophales bacterium]